MDHQALDGHPAAAVQPSGDAEACAACGARPAAAQGFMRVMSFVIFTRHAHYEARLCRDCATRRALGEQARSALLGWWGIPWGLLTFKALWINTRTLMRWSRLPPVLAVLAGAAGLLVPAAAAVLIVTGLRSDGQIRIGDDRLDAEVYALLEEGIERFDAGDGAGAVARVEEARALAPDSPTVLFTLATLHRTRGDLAAALPLAARAAELAPTGYRQVAFHAVVLAESGRRDEARRLAERLELMVPHGPDEFGWTVVMHSALDEHEKVLELIAAHPDWLATDAYLRLAKLEALILLDRPEEAGHHLATLPGEDLTDPSVAFLRRVHAMRTAPLVAMLDLTADWLSAGYGETGMRMLAQAAERSGELAAARAHIRRWLAQPGTPQEAWFDARPWFAGPTWREALEAHVAVRPDVVPSILLLSALDAVTDRARVHRLADDFRRRDHPLAEMAQLLYFDTLDCSRAERLRQLEQHVDTHPGATLCLVALVTEHQADDPERARHYLERLEVQATDRAALRVACDYLRCELLVGKGEAERALAVLDDLPVELGRPYVDAGRYALLCAQAAFVAGREQELRDHLDPLLADREDSVHAAALLLRWSEQAARSLPITYRDDVDAWLADRGDEARSLRSASAQGILLAEGRVDSAWAGRATSGRSPDTFALVRALERLADGNGDLSDLRAVADSPRRGDFGPSLARTILSRRPG